MAGRARSPRVSAGEHNWSFTRYKVEELMHRACAVFGGTYVLGPTALPSSVEIRDDSVVLQVQCHPQPITASHLISSPLHLPQSAQHTDIHSELNSIARCIAVLDALPPALKRPKVEGEEEESKEEDDTAIVVFPPEKEDGQVVRALIMGEGTGSCPAGRCELFHNVATAAQPC
jgi:RAB protein geranylgeranyltransferase component A